MRKFFLGLLLLVGLISAPHGDARIVTSTNCTTDTRLTSPVAGVDWCYDASVNTLKAYHSGSWVGVTALPDIASNFLVKKGASALQASRWHDNPVAYASLPANTDGGLSFVSNTIRGVWVYYASHWFHATFGWVDCQWFGCKANDLTFDQTSAVAAAEAALSEGGTLVLPGKIAGNFVFRQRGLHVVGPGGSAKDPTVETYLTAWDVTKPVVQIGADLAYDFDISLSHLVINCDGPNGLGEVGLRLHGGAYGGRHHDIGVRNCKHYEVLVQSGNTYPIAHQHFDGLVIISGNDAAHIAGLAYIPGVAYNAAHTVDGLHLDAPGSNGQAFYMKDMTVTLNGWIQCFVTEKCVTIEFAGGSFPYITGNGLIIDGGSASDTMVTTVGASSAEQQWAYWLRGLISVAGRIKWQDGTTLASYGGFSANNAAIAWPKISGCLYLTDATVGLHNTTNCINADSAGRLNLGSGQTIRLNSFGGTGLGSIEANFGAGAFTGGAFSFGATTAAGSISATKIFKDAADNHVKLRNHGGALVDLEALASAYGGTGNGFTKFSGPTTSEKTFTLPDASATLTYLSTQSVTCTAGGGVAALTITLTAPMQAVLITNSDADGCNITVAETNAVSGWDATFIVISNAGATVNFADTGGVTELAGAFAADINDVLHLKYGSDRWHEVSRSAN